MSRAALLGCTALALLFSVGAAHAGPEIPWQFHGRWCSQEHKYGTDTLIFGRQGSVADCNMEISRHALVAGDSQFTIQCEPLEIILRRDYRYQYKGKCSVFDKTAKKDLGAPSIMEGTAWITASNLLVIKSKPKPESKEEEPKESEYEPLISSEYMPRVPGEPVQPWTAIIPGTQIFPTTPPTVVVWNNPGGILSNHVNEWRKVAAEGSSVEIMGECGSGCTFAVAYVPKEQICFGPNGFLSFHQVRVRFGKDMTLYPDPKGTNWMVSQYPEDIRRWIDANGGWTRLPWEGSWVLTAKDLWMMGYRKCSTNIEDRRGDWNVFDEERIPADWVRAKEGKYLKNEYELVPYEPVPQSRGWQR
jgi:hypothetical protein